MNYKKPYTYAVIGAGPAGINAIAKLLNLGISGNEICWIDPTFLVGDFGTIYADVPGNTDVASYLPFLNFLEKILRHFFHTSKYSKQFEQFLENYVSFKKLPSSYTCFLKEAAKPIQHASNLLRLLVNSTIDFVTGLTFQNNLWCVSLKSGMPVAASRIILANGAEPKKIILENSMIKHLQEISLEKVSAPVNPTSFDAKSKIAIIGSSHSAALAVMQFIEAKKSVYWFKRNATELLRYAEKKIDDLGAYTLYDNTGLKGEVASWHKQRESQAQQVTGLFIIELSEEAFQKHLPCCTHIVYAIGFEPRHIPVYFEEKILSSATLAYDKNTGAASHLPNMLLLGIGHPLVADEFAGRASKKLLAPSVGISKFFQNPTEEVLRKFCDGKI